MKKTYISLLAVVATLSFASTVKAETKDIPLVNGVSEIERTVYNVHFSDGTTKFVTGPLKHSGGDLSSEIKKQIDDFFAKKATEWKASLKVATDDGTRNIDAITPTKVRLSVVSISFGDTNYIRVAPITVDHKHGSTVAHRQQVETLWNPVKSIKKAADKTVKTVKKGADKVKKGAEKAVDLGKKAAPYVTTAVKGLAPAIIQTVPEAIAGASAGSTLGSSIGGSVGGAIGSVIPGVGNLTGAIIGIAGGTLVGGAAGVLIPVGKNLIPAAIKTTKDLKKEKDKSKEKKKDSKKSKEKKKK